MEDYDRGSYLYVKSTKRKFRYFTYYPTFEKYFPDPTGKEVLDLGCGDGVSSRMIKNWGAKRVLGVDSSSKMIEIARNSQNNDVEYKQIDLFESPPEKFKGLGKFDIVSGIMFIHYAWSRDVLYRMFLNIREIVNDGGQLFFMTLNPSIFRSGYDDYGVRISRSFQEGDNSDIEIESDDGSKMKFKNYYWKIETYLDLLNDVGFKTEVCPGIVSKEGLDKMGEEYWIKYKTEPLYLVIRATLKP